MNTDEEFTSITNELVAEQAYAKLDQQVEWTELWRSMRRESDEPAELRDFIRHMIRYRLERRSAMYVLAVALWKLAEQEDRL